jgi:protoporphyrin/coproporphyrin ferrochelatase
MRMDKAFRWSVIDRWHSHPRYVSAVAERVRAAVRSLRTRFAATAATAAAGAGAGAGGAGELAPLSLRDVTLVFSAHSVPIKTVAKGDPYVGEIFATVEAVMNELRSQPAWHADDADTPAAAAGEGAVGGGGWSDGFPSHVVSWQSKVGFLPWMGPATMDVITKFVRNEHVRSPHSVGVFTAGGGGAGSVGGVPRRRRALVLVPIAFTSDHIETLYELDIECASHFAAECAKTGVVRTNR